MRPHRVLQSILGAVLVVGGAAQAAAPTQFSTGAGEVRDFVAVSATTGYAATLAGGLWKSTNSGANWSKTSLTAKSVWKVSANPNDTSRLYAAAESGIYRSTDAGVSWTRLTQDAARSIAVSPGSAAGGPDTLLVGVYGVGILRSTDSGVSFSRQSSGLDNLNITGIVYGPGNSSTAYLVVQCNLDTIPTFTGNWGGVFRSINTNAGTVNWSVFNDGLPPPSGTAAKPCVNAITANNSAGAPIIVVGTKDPITTHGTTYRVTAGSPNVWTVSSSNPLPFGVEFLGPDFSNSNAFFMGSYQVGPYRSGDGGVTFASIVAQVTDPDMATQAYAAGAFTSTVWVAGINGLGLMRTTTGASPWSLPAGPVRADRVNDLTNHNSSLPGTYYMALKNGGVMKSTDSGLNWAQFNTGLQTPSTFGNYIRDVETIGAHPSNASVVALGIRALGAYQLNAGSSTWFQVSGFASDVVADHKPKSLVITPGGKVFYSIFDAPGGGGAPGGLYTATATGTTIGTLASAGVPRLVEANPGAGVGASAYRVRPSPSAPQVRVFLITFGAVPYRSMDGGANWTRVATTDATALGHAFFDIAEKGTSALTLVASTNRGIYRSNDDGGTWARINASGLNSTSLAAMVYAGGTSILFGGDFNGQLYCSTNDGTTWQAVTGGSLGATIRDMKYMNGSVHILTDGAGFWKKDAVCS